tara:strand:+ start:5062 stop:5646 length:585 start_codon:yes stop_codon:yes gene_type:complete
MKKQIFTALLLLSCSNVDAALITVELAFDEPSWSGYITYDSESGNDWLNSSNPDLGFPYNPRLRVYSIADLTINYEDVTFTSDDFSPLVLGHPPGSLVNNFWGLILDVFDNVGMSFTGCDQDSVFCLGSSISTPFNAINSTTLRIYNSDTNEMVSRAQVSQATTVNAPSSFAFMFLLFIGFGFSKIFTKRFLYR